MALISLIRSYENCLSGISPDGSEYEETVYVVDLGTKKQQLWVDIDQNLNKLQAFI